MFGSASHPLASMSAAAAAAGATSARTSADGSDRLSVSRRMTYPSRTPAAQATPATPATPRRIKELRPGEIAAIIEADPRLIIPVGTCEQHGRHLPLGSDTLIVEHLADDLSAEFGILRAPSQSTG